MTDWPRVVQDFAQIVDGTPPLPAAYLAAWQKAIDDAVAQERERCARIADDFHRCCDCKEMIAAKIREKKDGAP